MPTKPFLPGEWAESNEEGRKEIDTSKYNQLYVGADFAIEGIPSPWAAALWFKRSLGFEVHSGIGTRGPSGEKLWTLFLGLYLNLLELEEFPLKETHPLSQVLRSGFEFGEENFELWGIKFNGKIVGGSYPDCLLFPAANVDESIFRELQEEIHNGEKNIFDNLSLLKANLAAWAQGLPPEWNAPWVRVLKERIFNWSQGVSPLTSEPQQSTSIKAVTREDDNTPVTIRCPFRISHKIQDILTLVVCCFTDGEKKVFPDIPVKPEFLSRIDIGRSRYCTDTGRWLVTLKDGTIFPAIKREIADEAQGIGSIFVWPDFYSERWRINYLTLNFSLNITRMKIRAGSRSRNGEYIFSEPLSSARMERIDGLEVVAVECYGQPLGVYYVNRQDRRKKKELRDDQGKLALDFGTTNTCLALDHSTLTLMDRTVDILGFDYLEEGKSGKPVAYWLPSSSIKDGVKILPSEIVFRKPLKEAVEDLPDIVPTRDFTIWRDDTGYSDEHVIENFKWDLPPDSDLSLHRGSLIRSYLEFVMEMALAEVDFSTIDWKFTYPLAFNSDKAKVYCDVIRGIAKSLQYSTGVVLQTGSPVEAADHPSDFMIGESYAGLFATPYATKDGYYLTADLGGGTSDIALIRVQGLSSDVLLSDSLPYGGRNLIEFLGTNDRVWHARAWGTIRPQQVDKEVRKRLIQHAIRTKKIYEIRDKLSADTGKRSDIERGVEHFFEGLIEYLAVLLLGKRLEETEVKLIKLGKGWHLLGLAGRKDDYVEESLKNDYGLNIAVVSPEVDSKEAIAIGAVKCKNFPPASYSIKSILGWDTKDGRVNWQEEIKCTHITDTNKGSVSFKSEPPSPAKKITEYLTTNKYKSEWSKSISRVEGSFRDASIDRHGIQRSYLGHFLSEFHAQNHFFLLP